tara:strand:- start:478 stop:1149 length:672 start_codon:yes stop_codon:yes gene_type:complete
MPATQKKTAKATATKTPVRATKIKTNKSQRKAKTEKPELGNLNAPLFATVIDNTEKLAENAKTGLSYWKAIGDNLIEIRKNWIAAGGDIKARGEASFASYRETSSIGFMSKQDVSDAILIAKNWSIVTKIDDTESLNGLGVSACKKAIKAAQKPTQKQGPATSATSKKANAKADTGIDLSSLMKDPTAFGELIGKLVNSKYTDEQKAAFVEAAGEHIIIAETK